MPNVIEAILNVSKQEPACGRQSQSIVGSQKQLAIQTILQLANRLADSAGRQSQIVGRQLKRAQPARFGKDFKIG